MPTCLLLTEQVLHASGEHEGVGVELALQWTNDLGREATVYGFTNSIRNKDGGRHCEAVTGRALGRMLNDLARERAAAAKAGSKTRGAAKEVRVRGLCFGSPDIR